MNRKTLRPTTIIPPELYVERAADRQLREIVNDMGRPGYVLVARQMGKTNLLLNMKRERCNDIVLYLDLSNRAESARAWFRHVIDALIEANPEEFVSALPTIAKQRAQGPAEPSTEFDRSIRILLRATDKKVIIVLDEIDSLVNATYSDSILAQIRSMYFSRVNYSEYERLTYVLSGVAEPTDLIKDKNISPFNIGEKIYLEDFSRSEFAVFTARANLTITPETADRVFYWAQGNPRMTWDICSDIEDDLLAGKPITPLRVDEIVERLYLRNFDRAPVDHIRTLVESDPQIRAAVVAIRYGRAAALDDRAKSRLYLAGIGRLRPGGALEIKNNIIDAALSDRWIEQLASGRRTLLLSAEDSFRSEQYEEACRLFEQAVAASGSEESMDFVPRMHFGLSLLWTGRSAKAVQELSWCLESTNDPGLQQKVRYWIGAAHVTSGSNEEGLTFLREALDGPNEEDSHQARVTMVSAYLRLSPRQYAGECLTLIDKVLSGIPQPKTPVQVDLIVSGLFNRAQVRVALGETSSALEDLNQALAIAPAEMCPVITLFAYDLERNDQRRKELATETAVTIIKHGLKPTKFRTGTLKLTRERIATTLAYLAQVGDRELAAALLEHAVNTFDGPKGSALEVLLDLFDELGPSEKRRAAIDLIRAIVEEHPEDCRTPLTCRRAYRALALYVPAESPFEWVSRYMRELERGVPPERLEEEDATALMHIALTLLQMRAREEFERVVALHDFYSEVMQEGFLLQHVLITVAEMRYYVVRGDHESARHAAALLLQRADALQEGDGLVGLHAFVPTVRKEAQSLLRTTRSPTPIHEPFRGIGRNQKVRVQYGDEAPIERKFKLVAEDLRAGKCKLVG